MKTAALLLACMALLTACGERPQTLGGAKRDEAPYTGTGKAAFTAPDWKSGDKTSWEQELKARGQYGQNDYSRTR